MSNTLSRKANLSMIVDIFTTSKHKATPMTIRECGVLDTKVERNSYCKFSLYILVIKYVSVLEKLKKLKHDVTKFEEMWGIGSLKGLFPSLIISLYQKERSNVYIYFNSIRIS